MVDIDYSKELSPEERSKLTPEQRRDYLDARKRMRNGSKISDIMAEAERKAEPPVKESSPETREHKKQPKEKSAPQTKKDSKGKADKGLGTNSDGTSQRITGRKKIPEGARKVTLQVQVRKEQIDSISNKMKEYGVVDTVQHLLSEYIASHIDDILSDISRTEGNNSPNDQKL